MQNTLRIFLTFELLTHNFGGITPTHNKVKTLSIQAKHGGGSSPKSGTLSVAAQVISTATLVSGHSASRQKMSKLWNKICFLPKSLIPISLTLKRFISSKLPPNLKFNPLKFLLPGVVALSAPFLAIYHFDVVEKIGSWLAHNSPALGVLAMFGDRGGHKKIAALLRVMLAQEERGRSSLETLRKFLSENSLEERIAAVQILGKISGLERADVTESLLLLQKVAMKDSEPEVRIEAVKAVEAIG